jgi:hypothetical protein
LWNWYGAGCCGEEEDAVRREEHRDRDRYMY